MDSEKWLYALIVCDWFHVEITIFWEFGLSITNTKMTILHCDSTARLRYFRKSVIYVGCWRARECVLFANLIGPKSRSIQYVPFVICWPSQYAHNFPFTNTWGSIRLRYRVRYITDNRNYFIHGKKNWITASHEGLSLHI